MRTALAFLQTGADVLTSVVAPLDPVDSPRPGFPAFFAPDFAMPAGGASWFHVPTESVRAVPCDAFARQYGAEWPGPPLTWTSPDEPRFAAAFKSLSERLAGGGLQKGVPVTVMRAALDPSQAWSLFAHAVTRIPVLPTRLYAYGLFLPATEARGPEFVIGATPELLFDLQDGRSLSTMAVAGTRRIVEGNGAGTLESSRKNRTEHQSVVDDLLEQLSAWGKPSASGLESRTFGQLEHLAVDIRLQSTEWLDFGRRR
jgi:isochorismate synthase EntC